MHGIAGELNFICLRFFLIANSLAFTSKREQPSQGEGTGRGGVKNILNLVHVVGE